MRYVVVQLAICVSLLLACSEEGGDRGRAVGKQSPSVFTLSWPGYDGTFENRFTADYVLDGRSLGRGRSGFQRLLDEMRGFPPGSSLKVQFQPTDMRGNGHIYYLAFAGFENYGDFFQIAKERRLKLDFPSE